jgi:peptide/nickel transport system permease protein
LRHFLIARTAQAAMVVVLVVSLAFVLVHAAPGDPFGLSFDNPNVSEAYRARERARFGYDRPLGVQYVRWIGAIARGNLGVSHSNGQPVIEVLERVLPRTFLLMGSALFIGLFGGAMLGTWQAARAGTPAERATGTLALIVLSVPEFLLALAAISILSVQWRWFPVTGMVDTAMHDSLPLAGRVFDVLRHLVLPAGTLALVTIAAISRFQRTAVLNVLPDDFVRTARATGASERRVLWRHAFPNSLAPLCAITGLMLPALFGGAVFVEKIFAWPGMGSTMVNAVLSRDYPLVLAGVMVSGMLVALGSAVADILAVWIDPRIGRAV